jgi:arylsulfatase A-like enzyme
MRKTFIIVLFSGILFSNCETKKAQRVIPPNILFIVIDDLNDWVGCMDGHPQSLTPNIDRLASMGMLFTNAHAQCAICNPSRASIMTGLYPETTGIYFNAGDIKDSPVAAAQTLLTNRFEAEGYYVTGAGKIFHGGDQNYMSNYAGNFGGFGPYPEQNLSSFSGSTKLWDWGIFPEADSLMTDYKVAGWGIEMLKQEIEQPFLMGLGFYSPHVPLYAPEKWFNLFPPESIQLPETKNNDLEDISPYALNLTRSPHHLEPSHEWILEQNQWEKLVQSYLATISFMDQQVGKVLDALEKSDYKENTFVILLSDNGFHMGEKKRWGKQTLWEESTRVPLIIAGPGIKPNQICNQPVQLLDIYPTLLELAGLENDPTLEGHSLVPLLKSPEQEWPYKAISSFGPGNYSIRSERFRYIRYNDGSEEFYDHSNDPNEWNNLISHPAMTEAIKDHVISIPEKKEHPVIGSNSTGHKAYSDAEAIKSK